HAAPAGAGRRRDVETSQAGGSPRPPSVFCRDPFRPDRSDAGTRRELDEAFVKTVDHVGHAFELVRDHAEPVLAKMLGLDVERARETLDHVVRGDRPVAVDEMVQVAGAEVRLRSEASVGRPRLVHEPLDRIAERLRAEPASFRHLYLLAQLGELYSTLLSGATVPEVDPPVFEGLAPDCNAPRQ